MFQTKDAEKNKKNIFMTNTHTVYVIWVLG
jgi:hypothetical protein